MPSLNEVLGSIPGVAGYEAARQRNEQGGIQQIQQYSALQDIFARQQALQQEQALRAAVAASGGDIEKAMQSALASGNVAAAAKLAPIIESQRKAKMGQPIGSGGLLQPGGQIIPPAERGMQGPKVRPRFDGTTVIQEELQPDGTWKEIGRGPRFSPGSDKPSFQFGVDKEGRVIVQDRRTGNITPGAVQGQPVESLQGPAGQGAIAGARQTEKGISQEVVKAQGALPQTIFQAEQALNVIDTMVGKKGDPKSKPHPGFHDYVGFTWRPGMRFVEGSDAANFQALHNQLTGRAFMQAYETLKGGGQITEIEGRKGTEAINRMNKAQSEAEYIKAAREFEDVLRTGVERAKNKASGAMFGRNPAPSSGAWSIERVP